MRKVILYIATSLDGYIARPDGAIDWLPGMGAPDPDPPPDPDPGDYGYADFYGAVDTVIVGRTTYEQSMTFDADPFPDVEVVVLSRTRAGATEGRARFTDGDPKALIAALRAVPGGHIWLVGGAEVVGDFMAADLIDEIIVTVIPVAIGRGIPLFPPRDAGDARWRAVDARAHGTGGAQVRWVRG